MPQVLDRGAQSVKNTDTALHKVMSGRWIVERRFAWLEKNRRGWKNGERKPNTSLQFIHPVIPPKNQRDQK